MENSVQKEKRHYPDAEHLVSSYFHLSLPVVLGSIVTIVYNLADTYFIAFLKDILLIGITAAITNIASSLCVILLNQQLLRFGDEKIAAMGIVLKVTMITQMILVGFSFGGIPLFGFLTGAGEKQKVQRLLRFCLLFLTATALVMTGLVFLAAGPLLGMITPDEKLIADGILMIRWQVAGSVFAGIVMLMTCLCQASGKAVPALVLSLSRQSIVFVIVPVKYIFTGMPDVR